MYLIKSVNNVLIVIMTYFELVRRVCGRLFIKNIKKTMFLNLIKIALSVDQTEKTKHLFTKNNINIKIVLKHLAK